MLHRQDNIACILFHTADYNIIGVLGYACYSSFHLFFYLCFGSLTFIFWVVLQSVFWAFNSSTYFYAIFSLISVVIHPLHTSNHSDIDIPSPDLSFYILPQMRRSLCIYVACQFSINVPCMQHGKLSLTVFNKAIFPDFTFMCLHHCSVHLTESG